MNTAPFDARAVANYFLDLAQARNVELSQLVLLKLIYFAHGWYLVTKNQKLVRQDFEAWKHGPVIKVVRDAFKDAGKGTITWRAKKLDIILCVEEVVPYSFDDNDVKFLNAIFDEYHGYGAWKLSDLTHEPGSPWDRIWNSDCPVGRFALRLTDSEIRAHFLEQQSRNPVI